VPVYSCVIWISPSRKSDRLIRATSPTRCTVCRDPGVPGSRSRLRRVARRIIEEIGETRPSTANLTTKIMRCLFAYAVDLELRPDNPFARIKHYNTGTHHTWTDAEIAAYEAAWRIGTRERLAFDLLLYTAQRVGDVARMRRSDLRDGEIHITQEKTGTEIGIPVHPDLLRSLKATPVKGLSLIG
jgi:integrase